MTKPEGHGSLLQRSFRRSFRKTRKEEAIAERKSAEQQEEEEQKMISELRNAVNEITDKEKHGDNFLRRCLKAKNMDMKEAEKLIRSIATFQKVMRTELAEKEIKLTQANKDLLGTGFIGFDKEGCPIRVMNIGSLDLKGLISSTSTIELMKFFVHFLEADEAALAKENKKTGRNTFQLVHIIDLNNLSATQAMYKPIIDTAVVGLKLLQEYYHEVLKHIIIINAPSIFSTLYKMLKPAIGEDLQNRIKIFGRDEWKDSLLDLIDADVLPKQLGGNKVDEKGDPKCSALIGQGGVISEMYYTKEESFLDSEMPDVTTTTVPAASCINISQEVREAGSIVKWHIQSKDNDIGIGLFYEPFGSEGQQETFEDETIKKSDQKAALEKLEQLTPIIRSQCQITPEVGHMSAWRPGRYVMHLDNSYSWMSPKQIMHKIEVVSPSEQYQSNDEKLVESIKNL